MRVEFAVREIERVYASFSGKAGWFYQKRTYLAYAKDSGRGCEFVSTYISNIYPITSIANFRDYRTINSKTQVPALSKISYLSELSNRQMGEHMSKVLIITSSS
jgi:hypothetical protein